MFQGDQDLWKRAPEGVFASKDYYFFLRRVWGLGVSNHPYF